MIRGGAIKLAVRDLERAVRFYVETLGMKLVEDGGDAWAVIDAGDGLRIGLGRAGDALSGASIPTGTRIDFAPKLPLAEAIAILDNRGVAFTRATENGAELALFTDPDGNALALRTRS
jgi:catechol 2,3-dioxygenase-like lactoylglutathione lyase family enzyme